MEEKTQYRKSDFYYELPDELIAQTPAEPRDSSRLLIYDRNTKKIEDRIFRDIKEYVKAGTSSSSTIPKSFPRVCTR